MGTISEPEFLHASGNRVVGAPGLDQKVASPKHEWLSIADELASVEVQTDMTLPIRANGRRDAACQAFVWPRKARKHRCNGRATQTDMESSSSDTQTTVVSELPTVPDFPVLPSSEMMESDDPGIKEDVNKILSMLADMLAERRTLPS